MAASAITTAIAFAGRSRTTEPARPVASTGAPAVQSLVERQMATQRSDLRQIDAANVGDLEGAWVAHTGDVTQGATKTFAAFEDEPMVIAGNLISCAISRRIIAFDPETGKRRWLFDPKVPPRAVLKCRGVASWTDPQARPADACATRLLFATADNRLIALDARTGRPCAGFGAGGTVQMASSRRWRTISG